MMGHKICVYEVIWLIISPYLAPGNELEGDVGYIVSLQAQTYFQLREKFKCIEH